MAMVYVVQHGEKQRLPGDPGLTRLGRAQALLTAKRLRGVDFTGIYASPLLRARQTAESVAGLSGLPVRIDARLTERMNWDGSVSIEEFVSDWARATADRDFVPAVGDSSRAAGNRFAEFLAERSEEETVAVGTHGGVTVDLLRTLLGDGGVPERLLSEGVPSCAITILNGLKVVQIASVAHLERLETRHRPG